jgi:hypothetical protein
MRWVKIEDIGDTEFLVDEQVDKFRFFEENQRVRKVVLPPRFSTNCRTRRNTKRLIRWIFLPCTPACIRFGAEG